jgi:hypothetical protein
MCWKISELVLKLLWLVSSGRVTDHSPTFEPVFVDVGEGLKPHHLSKLTNKE